MGKFTATDIKESPEELLKLMRKAPLAQARLRAFYLYKSGQVRGYEQLGQEVGYERHAVGRWFRLYREKGLGGRLDVATEGRPRGSIIQGKALEELQAKLEDASGCQ